MALPILVDGAALDATSFGELDDDGYWNPIEFTGADTVDFVDPTGFTNIGDMTEGGGLAAAFDGTQNAHTACARLRYVGTGYVGKDWGSGNTKSITEVAVQPPGANQGWHGSGTSTITLDLLGSATNDPATATNLGGGLSFTDSTSGFPLDTRRIVPTDTTAYRYHWVKITSDGITSEFINIAEVQFYEDSSTAGYGTNGGQYDFADTAAFGADVKTNTNTMTPTYESQYFDTSNLTTYTFSACDLGTADADRSIIVAVGAGRITAGSRTVSSLTIGGVSATFAGRKQTQNLNANEIWYAKVPTGATGDVVVTFNAGMIACGIGIWSVLNLGPVQDVQGDNTSGNVASQSVSIGGGETAFAVFNVYDEGTVSAVSWSTATERYEDLSNELGSRNAMGADYAFSSAANATTVTATYTGTGGNDGSLLGVTFGKPNDNFYKANNFTADDQLSDTPTDSADDGFGNRPTLNPNDKSTSGTFTFSNGNRTVTQTGSDVKNAFCTMSLPTTGKIYFECYWSSVSGDPSMGITTTPIWTYNAWKGAVNGIDTADADKWLWNGDNFFDETSSTSYSGFGPDAAAYEKWAIDLDTGKVWSGNSNNGWANSGDPAAGTGELATIGATELASGLVVFIRLRLSVVGTVNFGQVAFNETPPTGFSGWSTADFAAPTIADGSDYFNTVLYTSDNSGSQSIDTGHDSIGLIWMKNRDQTYNHQLIDIVRGANQTVNSNLTTAETTQTGGSFSGGEFSFDSTWNIGFGTNDNVAWCWKAGGAAVTNSIFSITSQVSVNTTSGFSIVTYTAPASPSTVETVGHGLGAVPGMMIWKNRTDSVNWYVWHKDLAANNNLKLNSTAAQTNDGVIVGNPPASPGHFNTFGALHTANKDYVAYCWAEVEGFSKFGSYTGNGSTDGPFVYCGFKPAFLMIKRFDSTGSWHIYDKERLGYNPNNNILYADTNNAEISLAQDELLSNGFKMRNTGAARNASGGTYVFVAFAENPFQGDDGYTQGRAR